MPKNMTFSTKSKNWSGSVEVTLQMPSTLDDMELIRKRFGTPERMVEEACRNAIIGCQGGMRKRDSKEAAAAYAEKFVDDGRKDTYVQKVVISAEGFSKKQIEAMRAAGAIVE